MLERRAHAHAAFFDCAGAQPDKMVSRQPGSDVDLGADTICLDAEHRSGLNLRQHGTTLSMCRADRAAADLACLRLAILALTTGMRTLSVSRMDLRYGTSNATVTDRSLTDGKGRHGEIERMTLRFVS
jgi:hypothetical protein